MENSPASVLRWLPLELAVTVQLPASAQESAVRQLLLRESAPQALVRIVSKNRRRYGGYIVHVGIVLMFMGFAGEGFGIDEQALLKPGEQVQVDRLIRVGQPRDHLPVERRKEAGHHGHLDEASRRTLLAEGCGRAARPSLDERRWHGVRARRREDG